MLTFDKEESNFAKKSRALTARFTARINFTGGGKEVKIPERALMSMISF